MATVPKDEAEKRFKQASDLFSAGNYIGAQALLTGLAEAFPDEPKVKKALAMCNAKVGDLDTVISINPPNISNPAYLSKPGDLSTDLTADLLGPRPAKSVYQPPKKSFNWKYAAIGGIAALALTVGGLFATRSKTPEYNSAPIAQTTSSSSQSLEETVTISTDTQSDYPWLAKLKPNWTWEAGPGSPPDFNERVKKGSYDPLLGLDLESMVVPDEAYPDGKATIWIPTEKAREKYLTETNFKPTPAFRTVPIAKVVDVQKDKSKYGYFFVTGKFPSHVPEFDYSRFGEEPIYPFIGQLVPGTQDVLVDITTDGKIVPALTSIDDRIFRSINWPRERYMEAIERARGGRAEYSLSNNLPNRDYNLTGIISITGDTVHMTNDQGGRFHILPGSIIVMTAKRSDYDNQHGSQNIPNRINLNFIDSLIVDGTEQSPIVWTSDAIIPAGNDWERIVNSSRNPVTQKFNIIEYGKDNLFIISNNHSQINLNDIISRYSEGLYGHLGPWEASFGIRINSNNVAITESEMHNNTIGISALGNDATVHDNLSYNNLLATPGKIGVTMSISTGMKKLRVRLLNNICVFSDIGIASEGFSDENKIITDNIVTNNRAGIGMYFETGEFSNPTLQNNNVWNNVGQWIDGQRRVCDYTKGSTQVGGPWIVTEQYAPLNRSENPMFRNVKIWDLQSLN